MASLFRTEIKMRPAKNKKKANSESREAFVVGFFGNIQSGFL